MKYEVLKPFSADPGRSEVVEPGAYLVVKDASHARALQRAGLIGTKGIELTDEEAADGPARVITDLTSIPEPVKDADVEVEVEPKAEVDADKGDEVEKETKAIDGAPKNKDAASQRSVK